MCHPTLLPQSIQYNQRCAILHYFLNQYSIISVVSSYITSCNQYSIISVVPSYITSSINTVQSALCHPTLLPQSIQYNQRCAILLYFLQSIQFNQRCAILHYFLNQYSIISVVPSYITSCNQYSIISVVPSYFTSCNQYSIISVVPSYITSCNQYSTISVVPSYLTSSVSKVSDNIFTLEGEKVWGKQKSLSDTSIFF